MACIVKIGNEFENLSGYNTFIKDKDPNSQYFRVSKFQETFTAGKNLFLMEGSQYLKESTAVKIEIVDVDGGTLYIEPGRGVPDYYEGNSVVLSAHIYDTMPVGPAKITVLGELKEYIDEEGILRPVPDDWKGTYNVKWEKDFYINKNIENSTPVIFYKRPTISIEETEGTIVQQDIPDVTQSGSVQGRADIPQIGTDIRTWRAGTLYRLEITDGPGFTGSIDENIISVPSLGYSATVKEVLNKNTVLVDRPYIVDNKIAEFPPSVYSSTFEFFDGRTTTDTIVTGSYQRLVFKNIETFAGNLDKVKIYRKSRSDISDFKFLEEVKVADITSDLLVDASSPAGEKSGGAGRFTPGTFTTSWTTSSIQISGSDTFVSFDDDLLYESIKINVPSSSQQTDPVNIVTNTEFDIFSNVDYQVSLKTLVSGSTTDTIPGEVTVVSQSVSTTTYYLYDPNVMQVYPVSFQTATGFNSILIQSASVDLTRNYIYDDTRLSFFDTPQNTTGSSITSVSSDYTYDANLSTSLTFDTTSGDWGTTSRVQTDANSNANVVSVSGSFGGVELIFNVWLDSGSYTIPMSGDPKDVSIYSEVYTSGSEELSLLSFENIGGDAKFYYYNSSTYLDELSSFRSSTEYELEAIDTGDYETPQAWHSSGTGSQVIIPYEQSGYNYVHIDYRTNRNIEPLNADLIDVQRLDRLNGDLLYGESYDITSINFNTGEIDFTDGTEADFSGTLNIQNGQLVLTIDGDTQYAYLVEADFNNSVMVFIGRIEVGDMEPSSTRYNIYDLFQLSGSSVQNTSTSSFVVPRVPTQGGDNLYTEAGYPLIKATVSNRDFLTPVFDSESGSLQFESPLEIPYIFRNDGGQVTDVYTFDSSSGQVYNASSVSSSSDVNSDSFVYDNVLVQQGFVPSGSIHSDISTVESNSVINQYVNLTTKQHDHLSGSVIVSLLTDSGSLSLPTGTGSVEYHIESFVSESGYLSGNTIWRNSMAFRNFNTDGMMFYNHSATSQSAVDAISGSLNYNIDSIDTNDFQTLPLNMLESGSQVILDFETSGSGYNYIYLDYRTNRTRQVLTADLEEIGLVSEIDGSPIGNAKDTLALSGSEATTITSASYFTQQVPPTTSSIFYDDVIDYPFFPATIPAGNYIGDKTQPGVTDSILNSPLNIPYVLNISDSTPNEVIVRRIDAIFTASSAYGSTGTFETSSAITSQSLVAPPIDVPKTLKLYITGSSGSVDFKEYLTEIQADKTYSSRTDISNIITSTYESSNARLGIEARGDGWQLSKLDLQPAKARGFSPKVFKTVQEEDRNLQDETFDYKFEMYDVNNNYIPVTLEETVRFTGGNKQTTGTLKLLSFETDRTAFRFYSGSIANPPFQQIRLVATKQNLEGAITYASAAFDTSGQYIDPSSYSGTYPGGMTSVGDNGGIVTIANFSGSDTNYQVGSIIYTASCDNRNEFETIFRLEDGQPIADLIVNNDRSVFTYRLSDGSLNPSEQNSTITVKRKNLASNAETITANSSSLSGSAPPLTLISDNSTTGVATYFLSGSTLDLSTGSVNYQFTASDSFGVQIDNVTSVTPISFLEGVVLYLTNERGVLPAFYSGVIPSASYQYTSGSTKLYVGGDEVVFDNGGGNNTYKITGVTGSGITPNEVNPTTNEYGGVPGTMGNESSSLEINVQYTDSIGESYDFGRTANFNLVREGEQGQPGLEGSNGPGLLFTGIYDNTRDYTVTTGSLARRDAVIYNNVFYLAVSESGPSTAAGLQHPSSSADYWSSLGTGSNFVAAGLAVFAESYVQNNINVGTNNSGSASAANITIAGGTNYPYISIDQGATTGTQGYNVGNGIFLGINGNTGTGSFSIENGLLGDELLWDGSSLTIRGSIEFSNTPGAITDTLLSASLFSQNSATSASNAQSTADQVNTDLADVISGTTALEDGNSNTFIDSGIIYSPNIGGTDGFFSNAFRVGQDGITLDGSNKQIYIGAGNYGQGDTGFYVDFEGNFSLGDKFVWDGAVLNISGDITANAGSIAGFTIEDGTLESQNTNLVLDGSGDGSIILENGSSSVRINPSSTLTSATGTITVPSFNSDTISATSYDTEISSGTTGYLSTYDAVITTSGDSTPPSFTVDSSASNLSAVVSCTISPSGDSNTNHISSTISLGSGGVISGHNVSATLVVQLKKGSTVIATKTQPIQGSTSTTTNDVGGSYTITFNSIILEGGATYTLETGIQSKSSYLYGSAGSNTTQLTTEYFPPNLTSPSVTTSTPAGDPFTEITAGGFQVVSSTTKLVKIPLASSGNAFEVLGDSYFDGDIDATGNITAFSTSDSRLKQNVKLIPDALEKVREISGVTFDWKEGFSDVHKFEGHDIGVIAQEIEYILPEIVKMNHKTGYRGVKYEKLSPLLIEAIKELSKKVDKLEKEIKQLKG
jgi:hypothetical protein